MIQMRPNPRVLMLGALAMLALTCCPPARAEVSVVNLGPTGTHRAGLYLGYIIEDPNPLGIVWLRQSPQGSERVLLNEEGAQRGDGPPTTIGNPSGLCLVAWSMHTPTGYDVVYSQFADGAWSAPIALANSSFDEMDPFLIQGADGTVHLFYWEAGAVPRVLYRRAPSDLSSWSVPLVVSETAVAACRPSAVFHEGTLFVTYEVHDYGYGQSPRQVAIARQDGDTFTREVLAITQSTDPVWPQIHSRNGKMWADWIDAPGRMLWTRREGPTSWTPTQIAPFDDVLQRDFFVRGTIGHLAGQ